MTDTTTSRTLASFADLLAAPALAHVATIGPAGEPQSTPVWFDWDGTYLRFGQTEGRQKLRNVHRDPRIAVSIVDPSNPVRYLEIRGRVLGIDDDPDRALLKAMSFRYTGDDGYQGPPGEYRVIVIQPVHTSSMG